MLLNRVLSGPLQFSEQAPVLHVSQSERTGTLLGQDLSALIYVAEINPILYKLLFLLHE